LAIYLHHPLHWTILPSKKDDKFFKQFFPPQRLSEAKFKNTASRKPDNSSEGGKKNNTKTNSKKSDVLLTSSSVCQTSALALV